MQFILVFGVMLILPIPCKFILVFGVMSMRPRLEKENINLVKKEEKSNSIIRDITTQ
jgi:hypothetical protein